MRSIGRAYGNLIWEVASFKFVSIWIINEDTDWGKNLFSWILTLSGSILFLFRKTTSTRWNLNILPDRHVYGNDNSILNELLQRKYAFFNIFLKIKENAKECIWKVPPQAFDSLSPHKDENHFISGCDKHPFYNWIFILRSWGHSPNNPYQYVMIVIVSLLHFIFKTSYLSLGLSYSLLLLFLPCQDNYFFEFCRVFSM